MGFTIIRVVNVAFEVYSIILLARILLSWIRHNPYQPVIRFIYETTEPYLRIFRRIIPPFSQIDFSPIVAFFVLYIIERIVVNILVLIFY
ncbi:MAG: YggT family protein [Desulfotomaculaceae bacterium]|nr:YggT family protein [Desulfotomaculaceae bacterium]MDD4766401.1 YggT family protein [Desulfotomaculaceae bacterium]